MPAKPADVNERIASQARLLAAIKAEMGKVIVGMDRLVDRMLIGLVCGGHLLLEGVPGLAKTTAIKTLAQTLGLDFRRISFTPDLLPADVIGTTVYNQRDASFSIRKGPVFTNLLLADEINRAPAKVQSALLEAMQERQVTIGDGTHPLPDPFFVMATQNPIEQEGTYPLPEAQVDRFMFKCLLLHPSMDEERRIMDRFCRRTPIEVKAVASAADIRQLRETLDEVYIDDKVGTYILDLVFATRTPEAYKLPIRHQIEYGASPRATLYLNMTARAHALLNGRAYATPDDVKAVAPDVLRHRIITTYEAEAEGVNSETIIRRLLETVPVP